MGFKRCFLAIDVPPLQPELDKLREALRGTGVRASFTDPLHPHVTLLFYGDLADQAINRYRQALLKLSFPAFTARLKGTGYFPSAQRPRVLWAGAVAPQLEPLYRECARACGVEAGEYSPHLTIARLKGPVNPAWQRIVGESEGRTFAEFQVKSLSFKESLLSPQGAEHAEVFGVPLA